MDTLTHCARPLRLAATLLLSSTPSLAMATPQHETFTTQVPTSAVSTRARMPRAVTSFGAAQLGGQVYVLGGYFGAPHDYHREGQSASFSRMTLGDGSWEELPSPGRAQSVSLVAHGSSLYRAGGLVALNAPGEEASLESVDTFARFDPLRDAWVRLPSMPAPRSSHMAATLGDTLYVAGGWRIHPDGSPSEWRETLLSYDLDKADRGTWTSIPAPFRRRALGVAATDGHLLAMGGIDDEGAVSSRADLFTPDREGGAWSQAPDYPESGFGISVVGIDGRFYASAGDGGIRTWAVGEDSWTLLTSWIFPRFFHQLVPGAGGELLALGGIARGGRVRHVESLQLDGGASPARFSHWALPRPGSAVDGQKAMLQGNSLITFGGSSRTGTPLRETFELDLARMSWSAKGALPATVSAGLQGVRSGVSPAVALQDSSSSAPAALFSYDMRHDAWDPTEITLPEGLTASQCVEHAGELWLFGGERYASGTPRATREVWRKSAEAKSFERVATELPRVRSDASMTVHEGRLVITGGRDDSESALLECDALDLESLTWSSLPPLTTARIEPQLISLGGRLVVLGGTDPSGAVLTRVEVLADEGWVDAGLGLPAMDAAPQAFAFGDRLLLVAPRSAEELVDVILCDLALRELAQRDVGGHFAR